MNRPLFSAHRARCCAQNRGRKRLTAGHAPDRSEFRGFQRLTGLVASKAKFLPAFAALKGAGEEIVEGEFSLAQTVCMAIAGKHIDVVHVAVGPSVFPGVAADDPSREGREGTARA